MENEKPKEIDETEFKQLIKKTRKLIKEKIIDELKRFISFYISRIEIGKDDITVILSFSNIVLLLGGGGGNRTRVRRPFLTTFSECSQFFPFPSARVN